MTLAVCLAVVLIFVMWITTLKFIALHFERLRNDLFTSIISLLAGVQEGMTKQRETHSQNGHVQ